MNTRIKVDIDLLKERQLSDEDIQYLNYCFKKFKIFYENSKFFAQAYSNSYGDFEFSDIYYHIKKIINCDKQYNILFAFLFEVIENSEYILSDKFYLLNIKYFDKEYKDYLEYTENEGKEHYYISKEKYLENTIKQNIELSNYDLGRIVKEIINKEPKKYNNEFHEYLKTNGLDECKSIFSKWFENCYITE